MTTRASYWQHDACWADRWHDSRLPVRVDVAVLGGGLSGLATALALRDRAPGAAIAVFEAERVGFGASGRSAGFLSPLAAPVWLLGARRSSDQAWAARTINTAVHHVAERIRVLVPAADVRAVDLSLEARGRIASSALAELAAAAEHVGLGFTLDRRDSHRTAARLALSMGAYTVHPYKLVRGIAERAVDRGVKIYERARVRRVDAVEGGARIVLDDERHVLADRVVVCTNAYTPGIELDDRPRAMVVHSFMTATLPLPAEILAGLAGEDRFTVEVNAAQAYHRMHAGRVIYGGIDALSEPAGGDLAVPPGVRRRLDELVSASFGLPSHVLPIEHAWSGRFHTTTTGLPVIRASRSNPAVVINVGYGGTGFALALACAPLAAALGAGEAPADDDARLLSTIEDTRLSVVSGIGAIARILARFASPWR